MCWVVEVIEKRPRAISQGENLSWIVRFMNLDIETEQVHDLGAETFVVTYSRVTCPDFEHLNVIRISRESINIGVFLQPSR